MTNFKFYKFFYNKNKLKKINVEKTKMHKSNFVIRTIIN